MHTQMEHQLAFKGAQKPQNVTAWATLELIISRGCVEECSVCPQPT